MGTTAGQEKMMQMILIRMERRFSAKNAGKHHPERICDRNPHYRETEGDQIEIHPAVQILIDVKLPAQYSDNLPGNNDAQQHRTAVPQKHFALLPKNVVQPEGRQSPYGNSRQRRIAIVVSKEIEQSQKTQNQDAQAGQ